MACCLTTMATQALLYKELCLLGRWFLTCQRGVACAHERLALGCSGLTGARIQDITFARA